MLDLYGRENARYYGYQSIGDLMGEVSFDHTPSPNLTGGAEGVVNDLVYFKAIQAAGAWVDSLYPLLAPFGTTSFKRTSRDGGVDATTLDVPSVDYEDKEVGEFERHMIVETPSFPEPEEVEGNITVEVKLKDDIAHRHLRYARVFFAMPSVESGRVKLRGRTKQRADQPSFWLEESVSSGDTLKITTETSGYVPDKGEFLVLGTPPLIRRAASLYARYYLYTMGQNFAVIEETEKVLWEAENTLAISRTMDRHGRVTTGSAARAKPHPDIYLPASKTIVNH